MVQGDWFKRCADHELPPAFDSILQSWDTANKPGEFNDYSVCTTWGLKERRIYLLNVYRKMKTIREFETTASFARSGRALERLLSRTDRAIRFRKKSRARRAESWRAVLL